MLARSFVFMLLSLLLPSSASAQGRPLELVPAGESRALPERILGASAEAFWTDCLRDPAKAAAIKSLHLAYTRFPGGSQSNYYDWKRGEFSLAAGPNHSPYYEKIVELSHMAARSMPGGSFLEPYKAFCDSMGAEIIMVPNLETASVADQVAWFKHLSADRAVPTHIEMGNEFWIAMGDDPVVLRRWPDEPTAIRVTKRYLDAIKPYFPKGTKVAVQAAVPLFHGEPASRGKMIERLRRWNEDLRPEPWFDAVTIHLYPRLNEIIGHGAAEEQLTPQIARRNLRGLMARVDEGTSRQLDDLVRRLPGKEIWITEWNPAGAEGEGKKHRGETTTPAMMLQLVTRMTLTFLRHPQVTVSQFFAVRFKAEGTKCMFQWTKGGFRAVPMTVALRWLNTAANGGATYQRFDEAGNPRVAGGGTRQESYGAVEAALFRSKEGVTLILQNAADEARQCKIGADLKLGMPAHIERLAAADLTDAGNHVAEVESVAPSADIQIPPYSLTRVTWNRGSETEHRATSSPSRARR